MSHDQQVVALTLSVVSAIMSLGFVTLIWKISWTLRGWVANEEQRTKSQEAVVKIIGDFIETQKDANDHLQRLFESVQESVTRYDEEREELHRSVRAMNRKIRTVLEGEGFEQPEHVA